ncbi:energy transducer TonB [Indibacter alkaliphilus]|uniref:energy transducer TonB n=1 Tax=Indibacter alkaliphilus TaxID=579922 RepID=UPI0002823F77|nr:energy transducer TonB [Indibacter alkaliphilus]
MRLLTILLFLLPSISSLGQSETTLEIKSGETDQEIYVIVDEAPQLKGGEKALSKFYGKKSEHEIAENRKDGKTVYFQMVINQDGSVSDLEILLSQSMELEKEVRRIVGLMPKWIPGIKNGKVVRTKITQELTFIVPIQPQLLS